MCKSQYINICFSEKDKELIAWANMVREDGQSINTWIQAVLLAEAVGENLDAGAVYVPKDKRRPPSSNAAMFGDDRQPSNAKKKPASGWQIRGTGGEFVAGSIISVRVTRPVMVGLIDSLHHSHKRIGPYAKAILRRKIRRLDSGPNIPPDESQIQDIFALYEDRFVVNAHRQPKAEPPAKHRNDSQQPGRNARDGSSLPAERNHQRKDRQPQQQNQDHQSSPPQQQKQAQTPQPEQQPQQKQEERMHKAKNPLLGYIN